MTGGLWGRFFPEPPQDVHNLPGATSAIANNMQTVAAMTMPLGGPEESAGRELEGLAANAAKDADKAAERDAGKACDKAAEKPEWTLGDGKSAQKWRNQMEQRGWTPQQIDDAIANGKKFPAQNNINPANGATRYVNPQTGRSVVIDNKTGQVIHVGGTGFKY